MNQFGVLEVFFICLSSLLSIAFPIYAIVDVSKSNNKDKVLWILIILVGNFVGSIIYWLVGRKNNEPKQTAN